MLKRRLAPTVALVLVLAGCGGSAHQSTQHHYTVKGATAAHSSTFGLPPAGVPRLTQSTPNATVTATVEMFDTVTTSTVPSWAKAVAGYTAGSWPTYLPLVREFPKAHHTSIAIQVFYHAKCLDVEPGDAVPSQVAGWIRVDIKAGFAKPCVYSNLSEWQQIQPLLIAAGIHRTDYFAWLAYWTYRPGLVSGYDLVQWTNRALNRNLDESTVSLAVYGTAPKPKPSSAQLARWTRARDASQRVYDRRACPTLAQRQRWYATRLTGPRAASRRRALHATRVAYGARSCSTFAGRVKYFDARLHS